MRDDVDPTKVTLEHWLSIHGTKTGTQTYNGVRYTDMYEVEWRRANNDWLPRGSLPTSR